MTLDTLIQELEKADGLATGGDCTLISHGDDALEVLRFNGVMCVAAMPSDEAQAIAIRHNTATDVLRYLKDVHWTNAANHEYGESQERLAEMVKIERARADRAESKLRSIAIQSKQHPSYDGGHSSQMCRLCDAEVFDKGPEHIAHKPGCLLATKDHTP